MVSPASGSSRALRRIADAPASRVATASLDNRANESKLAERRLADLDQSLPGALFQASVHEGDVALHFLGSQAYRWMGMHPPRSGRLPRSRALWHRLPEAARKTLIEAWSEAASATEIRVEFEAVGRNGKPRWLEARARRDTRDPGRWHGSLQDISREKRGAGDRVLAAALFDSARQGIMVTTTDCTIVRVNTGFEAITGYRAEEAIGRPAKLLSSGLTLPEVYQSMWGALKTCGHWEGELLNRRRDGEVYTEALSIDVVPGPDGEAAYFVGMFGDITMRKQQEERALFLAHHDPLTGLLNRAALDLRLAGALDQAQRNGEALAVIFIDLDHFKQINDMRGHAIGDRVLTETAQRLESVIRSTDLLARQGGDEFIVVMPGLQDESAIRAVCDNLLRRVSEPIVLDGEASVVGASIGVAIYPADGVTAADLLHHADVAMYHAKHAGRGGYHFFDEERNVRYLGRLRMVEAIEQALLDGTLEVSLRPLRDGAHPTMPPVAWQVCAGLPGGGVMDIATEVDLSTQQDLAMRVFDEILQGMADRPSLVAALQDADVPIAFRIHADACEQTDLAATLEATSRRMGLPLSRMVLMVSMRDLATASWRLRSTLRACRDAGVLLYLVDVARQPYLLDLLAELQPACLWLDPELSSGIDQIEPHAYLRGLAAACRAMGGEVAIETSHDMIIVPALQRLGIRWLFWGDPVGHHAPDVA